MKTSTRAATITAEHLAEAGRLRVLWDKNKGPYTQATFGEAFDVGSQSAVGFFLNGKSALSMKAAKGFAKGLNCSIADFSPRLASMADELIAVASDNDDDDFVAIERADVSFSNGHGRLVFVEGRKSSLSFRRDYLRSIGVSQKNAVIVQAAGRSNEPTIDDGAILLVNKASQEVTNGRFYAFRCDGQLLVKRLSRRQDGSILAVSDNPDREEYPDMVIDNADIDFELIGRVMWKASEL